MGLVFQDPKKEGECLYLIRFDLIFIQIYFVEFLVNLLINLIFKKSDSKYLCTIFCTNNHKQSLDGLFGTKTSLYNYVTSFGSISIQALKTYDHD